MLSTVCSCNKSRVERNYLERLKTNTRKITSSPQALTFSSHPQQKEYHRLGSFNNFPGSSAGKESTCNTGRPQFDFWVWKIPWRWEWLPTQGFRPGEFHGLYGPWGHKQSNMIERLHFHFLQKQSPCGVRASTQNSGGTRGIMEI